MSENAISQMPRTATGCRLYIKRATSQEWVLITDAKNVKWPQQPNVTVEDEYLAAGIAEKVDSGKVEGGEFGFQIGVKTANDAGALAWAAAKLAKEEVQVKGIYSNNAGYIIERVLVKSCELTEAKRGEICAFECAGDCNSLMTPTTETSGS